VAVDRDRLFRFVHRPDGVVDTMVVAVAEHRCLPSSDHDCVDVPVVQRSVDVTVAFAKEMNWL